MNKYSIYRKVLGKKIKKCKKLCRNTFFENYKVILLCWFVTAVVTFASFGTYLMTAILGLVLGKSLLVVGTCLGFFVALPLYVGNFFLEKKAIKGKKADAYSLFYCYFTQKKFWEWILMLIISLADTILPSAFFDRLSQKTQDVFPFLSEEWSFYISVIFEIIMLVFLFLAFCKTIFVCSLYSEDKKDKSDFEDVLRFYKKTKKYYLRYVLSHFHYFVILIFARIFPLWLCTLIYTLVIGYFSLSIVSFFAVFKENRDIPFFVPFSEKKRFKILKIKNTHI